MNYAEIISDLNELLFENGNIAFQFEYSTDGSDHIITFAMHTVWRSDEDNRNFNGLTNKYEPIKPYLVNQAKRLIQSLSEIKWEGVA